MNFCEGAVFVDQTHRQKTKWGKRIYVFKYFFLAIKQKIYEAFWVVKYSKKAYRESNPEHGNAAVCLYKRFDHSSHRPFEKIILKKEVDNI